MFNLKKRLTIKIIALVVIHAFVFTTAASAYPTLGRVEKGERYLRASSTTGNEVLTKITDQLTDVEILLATGEWQLLDEDRIQHIKTGIIYDVIEVAGKKKVRATGSGGLVVSPSSLEDLSERLMVRFADVGKDDVAIVGGKCANLGEMMHIPGIFVPDGIALTTKAYQIHIDKGIVDIDGQKMTLREYIDKRLAGLDYNNTVELGKASIDIRSAMEKAQIPEEIKKAIVEWYHKLGDNVFVAVRSSATAEDLPDASFAGQQETYLFKRGDQEVLDAVKYCWSSLFTPRAIFYRQENKIDHGTAYLSVAIQMMVDSKTSGVGFGVDVNYGMPRITINAVNELGEGAVSGTVTPDVHDYVYDVFTGNPIFYKKTKGSKLKKAVLKKFRSPKDREATEYVPTTEEERRNYALTDEQGLMVAMAIKAINDYYGRYMDVEWAFDAQGKLWIVQARSETIWNEQEKKYPDTVVNIISEVKEVLAIIANVLVKGRTGAPRAATGKVVIVVELEEGTMEERATALAKELDRVQEGDILVTKMTTPDMVPAMTRAAAVVTDEGGPNCHAAIVARELRIPCVVGTGNATQVLTNGMTVTVDARKAAVYKGKLEIIKSIKKIDISKLPITKTLIGIVNSAPDLAMEIWQFSKYLAYYGYGLFRKEFVDTTEILVHPLAGLAYDKYNDPDFKDGAQREEIEKIIMDKYGLKIEKIIKDYSSYAEFYVDKLATALVKIASAQTKGQRVKYRTTDFKTNEYRDQIGALPFEPQENNPMMGYRGIYRMLHEDYIEAFRLELRAIKKARQIQKNVDIMFPVVRTPEELVAAVVIMAEEGLFEDEDKPQIGMMVEVPSDVFQAEEFFSTLAELAKKYGTKPFMSIGSNDLTQFTLAIGRDNNKMAPFAEATNPAVLKALEIVIKTAKRFGVTSGFCGQEPSNNPGFAAHLVRAGIVSISAVPDVFDLVVNVVAEEEKKLEGKPFDPNIAGWEVPQNLGNPERITAVNVDAGKIIKNIGIHPQVLLSYDKRQVQDAALKQEIESKLTGRTAQQYVIDKVYEELMQEAHITPQDKPVIYQTDDLNKTVYETLLGGKELELFDENPALGFCGLARVVDLDYQEFLRWQIQGLKKARQDSGRKNIGIRLDLSRFTEEITKALEIIKAEGLMPGEDGFMVGMEIAGPSNVLLVNEFIQTGINFLSENNERFLSYVQALDPGSPYVNYSSQAKEGALEIPRRIWTNAAEQANIPLVDVEDRVPVDKSPEIYAEHYPEVKAEYSAAVRADLEKTQRAVIIQAKQLKDPLLGSGIVNLLEQLGKEKGTKLVLNYDKSTDLKKLHRKVKEATGGRVDLMEQIDFDTAESDAQEVLKEIKAMFEEVEQIAVIGHQSWAQNYRNVPGLEECVVVVCEVGEGNYVGRGDLALWAALNALVDRGLLTKQEEGKLLALQASGKDSNFFEVKSEEVPENKELRNAINVYRQN